MEEDNQKQKTDGSELEKFKKQTEEYLNNWKRERADFLNYKKDESRRVEELIKYINEGMLMDVIEIIDKLDVGLQHEPNETMKQLSRDFEKFLERYDVKKIEIKNPSTDSGQVKFDHMLHEAVEVEEGGKNLNEVRAGYTMHDRVIRPVRVKITK